jgi:hypothetical protein
MFFSFFFFSFFSMKPVDTKNTVAEVLLWNTDYQQLEEDFYKLGREFNPIVLAKG